MQNNFIKFSSDVATNVIVLILRKESIPLRSICAWKLTDQYSGITTDSRR
jgi:hypothetical protein